MQKIAESDGAILFNNGEMIVPYSSEDSEEVRAKKAKEYKRELVQLYLDSAIKNGGNLQDIRANISGMAPDFIDIAIDRDIEGNTSYTPLWKD